jgi:hypothetical protein
MSRRSSSGNAASSASVPSAGGAEVSSSSDSPQSPAISLAADQLLLLSRLVAALSPPTPTVSPSSTVVGLSGQDADVLIEALLKRTYRRMPRPANKEKGIAAEDCPFTGLNRGQLYELLNRSENGEIKTVSMRQEGETRAARLYNVGSVLEYLDRLAEEQKQEADAP